jgi:DNA-binding NarL/FixJ family response regulator
MNPRILIVDDHEIVREGIRNLLARSGKNWEVCGEASNASDAILAIESLQPDVVVLDITMPGISGLEAARLIWQARSCHPHPDFHHARIRKDCRGSSRRRRTWLCFEIASHP